MGVLSHVTSFVFLFWGTVWSGGGGTIFGSELGFPLFGGSNWLRGCCTLCGLYGHNARYTKVPYTGLLKQPRLQTNIQSLPFHQCKAP
eukprot:4263848-Amphidinium_carterae.1